LVFYNVHKPARGHGFYETPEWLYKKLDAEFNFDFDPCPTNPTFDGLSIEWGKSNFVNPPYKEIPKWVKKGIEEWRKGKTVVFLLPASTDTAWFHDFILPNAEIRFLRGRVRFTGKPAPFPSIVAILRAESGKV
jgi:site-specific DNA-methyltransferase (adenine-specific)